MIRPGVSATVNGSGRTPLTLDEVAFKNAGTLTVSGEKGAEAAAAIDGESNAVLVNSGTFILNTIGYSLRGPSGTKFINTGTLKKTEGSWTTTIAMPIENLGAIHVEAGKFEYLYPVIDRESSTQWGGGENPSVLGHPESKCGDPVSCATGNFSETQTDFSVGGRGVGLDLARTYNSQAAVAAGRKKATFGYGWSSSFSDRLKVNPNAKWRRLTRATAAGWPSRKAQGNRSRRRPGRRTLSRALRSWLHADAR